MTAIEQISSTLSMLIDELNTYMVNSTNDEIIHEIDNNVKTPLEAAVEALDAVIDDIDDGVYDDPINDEEEEEWD